MVIKEATVQHQVDTYHLICIYNVSHLRETYIEADRLYYTLRLYHENLDTYDEIDVYCKQIEYYINVIESKLVYLGSKNVSSQRTYLPRVKRGLINGLGSFIKAITGNLDQTDADRFENDINQLKQDRENSQKQTIGLMQEFMNEYKREITQIQHNQEHIATAIDQLRNSTIRLSNRINIINIYIQIEICMQQIYNKIALLENAITFSHLGVVHPSIIDPNYLLEKLVEIQNEISLKLPYEPKLSQIHLLEKSMTIKAYSTNETINFILEIPLIENEPYNLLHLYSIPNEHDMVLIPKSPYLVLGNNEFAYPEEPCKHITNEDVICKHIEWQPLANSEDCIAQLVQQKEPHNCTYAKAVYNNSIIKQIHENCWIAIMRKQEIIKTVCGNNVQYQRYSGVSLITITNKCKVLIMGKILKTHNKFLNIKETIPLPKMYEPSNDSSIKVDIQDVQLDRINSLIQKSKEISQNYTPLISPKPSWSSVMLLIITALGGIITCYILWKRRRASSAHQEVEDHQLEPMEPSQQTSSVRFVLKGGGVTSS